MNEEIKCRKCEAEMKSIEYLNEDSVCETCIKLGIKTKDEKKQDPDKEKNEGRLKNVIAKEIDRILIEYGILLTCECGNAFYKRSPAQKKCGNCPNVDKKETK